MGIRFNHDLTRDRLFEILTYEPDTGYFRWKIQTGKAHMGDIAGSVDHNGYVRIWIDGKQYSAHRLAFLYMNGEWPKGDVDHRELPQSDNRWANLREANHWQNMHNRIAPRKRNDPTMPTGVTFKHGGFHARIRINGKLYLLGKFPTKEEAGEAYAAAARKHAGEFARDRFTHEAATDWKQRAKQLEALLIQNGIALDALDEVPEPEALESGARE